MSTCIPGDAAPHTKILAPFYAYTYLPHAPADVRVRLHVTIPTVHSRDYRYLPYIPPPGLSRGACAAFTILVDSMIHLFTPLQPHLLRTTPTPFYCYTLPHNAWFTGLYRRDTADLFTPSLPYVTRVLYRCYTPLRLNAATLFTCCPRVRQRALPTTTPTPRFHLPDSLCGGCRTPHACRDQYALLRRRRLPDGGFLFATAPPPLPARRTSTCWDDACNDCNLLLRTVV